MSESSQITEMLNQVSESIKSQDQLLKLPELSDECIKSCQLKRQLHLSYSIEDESSASKRAIISLLLYILINDLRILSISRSIVKELHDKDPNWQTEKIFSDNDYKIFIEIIKGFGIRKITRFGNYKASIFYVDQESPVSSYIAENVDEKIKNIFAINEITRSSFVNEETLKEFDSFLTSKSYN